MQSCIMDGSDLNITVINKLIAQWAFKEAALKKAEQALKKAEQAATEKANFIVLNHEDEICIETLIPLGLEANVVKNLQGAEMYTCTCLMVKTKKDLCKIEGLSNTDDSIWTITTEMKSRNVYGVPYSYADSKTVTAYKSYSALLSSKKGERDENKGNRGKKSKSRVC
ncbi:unnamed protein product [Arabis nemorensis]|uniref:Uncharacterized protein n=1 Tax=Arabis nemorensis TaxID=586526 RepID=A0A565BRI1_9BRAS|nr:unnamed protein product [Arabis nemorensis]